MYFVCVFLFGVCVFSTIVFSFFFRSFVISLSLAQDDSEEGIIPKKTKKRHMSGADAKDDKKKRHVAPPKSGKDKGNKHGKGKGTGKGSKFKRIVPTGNPATTESPLAARASDGSASEKDEEQGDIPTAQ